MKGSNPRRVRQVFQAVLEKSAEAPMAVDSNAGRTRFGGDPPHIDDVWVSVEDAEAYAAYIDERATALAEWVALGDEPEDLAQCLPQNEVKSLVVALGSYPIWLGRWRIAYQDFREADFQGSWDGLTAWHAELKKHRDEFARIMSLCNPDKPVSVPEVGAPAGDLPKFGPGQSKNSDTLAFGIIGLGALAVYLIARGR